jgi:hypothetical protein
MLGFLVFSSVGVARTRREIPRGRRKKKVRAMSGRGGSWAATAAGLRVLGRLSPALRAAAAVAGLLVLAALVLGILGWRKPLLERQSVTGAPEQVITFSYTATVPKSAVYDGTTVTAPDPIFRKLANHIDLRTRYKGPAGTLDVTAKLTNGTGWHTDLTLVRNRRFPGPAYEASVPLDFPTLTARADAASRVIGIAPTGAVQVAITASVDSPNLPTFSAPVQLAITPLQMTIAGNATLTTRANASAPPDLVVPRQIRVFGHSAMSAAQARSYAIIALFCALAIAAVVLLVARRRAPMRTRAQIESRYPQLLVHVEPMPSPPGKPVVNVDNFPALVKLAEKYGQMILTWRRPDADDFVVRDEGITYRYRVPLDEPTLQNVELINRPSAGSHRRKASSPSQVS